MKIQNTRYLEKKVPSSLSKKGKETRTAALGNTERKTGDASEGKGFGRE